MRVMRALPTLLCLVASCATGNSAELKAPSASPVTTSAPVAIASRATPAPSTSWTPVPATARRARVARVVDGDTIVLVGISVGPLDSGGRPGRKARLIGVDTPEIYGGTDCYGAFASAFTKRELAGREVLVGFDVDPVDRYGRALVYIWRTDGVFFNAFIAQQGVALQMTVPPNVRYADLFGRYVREAREKRRGLWSAC
jgi:micrococcal nuclease